MAVLIWGKDGPKFTILMSSLAEIDVGQVSVLPQAYSRRSKLRVTGPTLVLTIDIMHLKLLAQSWHIVSTQQMLLMLFLSKDN